MCLTYLRHRRSAAWRCLIFVETEHASEPLLRSGPAPDRHVTAARGEEGAARPVSRPGLEFEAGPYIHRRDPAGVSRSPPNTAPRDPWAALSPRADPTPGAQRLVSYLVRTTPSGNARVSTRVRFTQLSRAVKNGVPPPSKTGAVASTYSSISPARMAAAASVAPPMSMGPPSSALSRVISVTASPVTRRVFQSTVLVVEEN